ncbi:MAG: T9SS type A sorting domain-containing protein, partial [Elusimicrobiales bacterium]|nr:T9SS type A sorting domain-containing protein [Elusimicrobiales bacterium]
CIRDRYFDGTGKGTRIASIDHSDIKDKIKLTFNPVTQAAGYKIYRSSYSGNNWNLLDLSSSTVYIDKTALCNATFSYKVTAYDDWFESDYSNTAFAYSINDNPLNDTIPPGNVSDLSVQIPLCPGVINYKFTQTGDDGFYGKAYYYEVGYSTFLPFSWNNSIKIKKPALAIAGDMESGVIEDLIYGVTYYIGAKVYDYAGNSSDLSNIVSANTLFDNIPPAPPVNFIAYDTPGDRGGRITLEWVKSESEDLSDCDEKIYGYKILRTTKTFDYSIYYATVSAGVYGFIDSNAMAGLRYNYRICSYDSSNMSCSDVKTAVSADNFRYVSVKNGGALGDEKGSAIFIKENSLNQDDYLIFYRIKKQEMENLSSAIKIQSSDSFVPTYIVYKFESSNPATKLNSNAAIKINYLSTETAGIEKNNLRMYYYDNGVWKMLRNSKINTDENSVVAEYDKFGYYALFGYKPQGDVFDSDWVYTYPNPAKGDLLTFKFVVNYKSDVDIEIYNVAGEMIKKLSKKDVLPGLINEVVWDIRNIASGVYIYIFKANGSGGKKSVNKKLAIIH